MPQTKTNTTKNAKQTVQKEIKTDFCKPIAERRNLAIRQQAAEEYIAKCKRKRIAKANQKAKIKENIVLSILFLALIGAIVIKFSDITSNANANTEHSTYLMEGELQGKHVVFSYEMKHEVSEEYANYTSEPIDVTVVLDDNGTEDVTDDKILDIFNR